MIEFGVAHSDGITTYFSPSPNNVFGVLVKEGTDAYSPQAVDALFDEVLGMHEPRLLLVVIEGGPEFLRMFQGQVSKAQAMVYCAPESVLDELGVEVIDRGWTRGDPQANLDAWLWA